MHEKILMKIKDKIYDKNKSRAAHERNLLKEWYKRALTHGALIFCSVLLHVFSLARIMMVTGYCCTDHAPLLYIFANAYKLIK